MADEKKGEVVTVRFRKGERAILDAALEGSDQSVAEYIRVATLDKATAQVRDNAVR